MTISADKKMWTDEDFMALSEDGHRYELVNGELVVSRYSNTSGKIRAKVRSMRKYFSRSTDGRIGFDRTFSSELVYLSERGISERVFEVCDRDLLVGD